MESSLTAREIDEWWLFDQIVGLPAKRDDIRAGVIAATLVNVQPRKKGTKRQAKQPGDFFPSLRPEPNRTSGSIDIKQKLLASWGGFVRKAADVNNSESGSDAGAGR